MQLMLELVRAERKHQPRLGVRKLYYLIQVELRAAGVKMGRDRLFEELSKAGLLMRLPLSSVCSPFQKSMLVGSIAALVTVALTSVRAPPRKSIGTITESISRPLAFAGHASTDCTIVVCPFWVRSISSGAPVGP